MNQKRTRVPLPHPPAHQESRVSYWLTVLAGALIAIAICLSIYMLIESWISGSITTNNRGPRRTYTLALQPRRYWFEFVWQSFWTAFMLAIGVFALWVYRKGRVREQRPKGKRTGR
jgi:ABC-type Fe3+ transport system permease subunit